MPVGVQRVIDPLRFPLQPKLKVVVVKNLLRILLKALVNGVFLPFSREKTNVPSTGEKAMTSNTSYMNHRSRRFAPGIENKPAPLPAPSSTDAAAASEDAPSRTFIAVLLRCLSAPNA
jgi:hypothetical protein